MEDKVVGLVFGKFSPFHLGHQALINYALQYVHTLYIVVCSSDKEIITGKTRKQWIEVVIINLNLVSNQNTHVIQYDYDEATLPNSSVSSEAISKIWADALLHLLPKIDTLFTSELYGDYVAKFMNIKHVSFDPNRIAFPISASLIKHSLIDNWDYLPDIVKRYFTIKVVILGTESVGKTTLANKLANYYKCNLVLEAGRALIANSNNFDLDDLNLVAQTHAKAIFDSIIMHPLSIIDTNIFTTISYADYFLKSKLNIDEALLLNNIADLYLYLNNDVPFVQDGTRLSIIERGYLDISHRKTLKKHKIPIHEISGNWEQRFADSKSLIDTLINQKIDTFKTLRKE